MRHFIAILALAGMVSLVVDRAVASSRDDERDTLPRPIQLDPRPFFLVEEMEAGPLKRELQTCARKSTVYRRSDFSIGHRGAPLQFPEHTKESYEAAARMGAGILECDVAFTRDLQLVCRHAQNDLHTTTNILATPLATKCTRPFKPAVFGPAGVLAVPAVAECRTSDITLAEFRTLRGKQDAFNPRATSVAEFMTGTPGWRTDLYAGPTSGTLMTHKDSIALFTQLGVKMMPELKNPRVAMPFNGFTQQALAQKMIDEYKEAGVSPRRVWAQSFNRADVSYWIEHEPEFGRQAVYLEDAVSIADLPSSDELATYKAQGIHFIAPPLFALLTIEDGEIVPSHYARAARSAGLGIIAWTVERSGILADGNNGFFYQTIDGAIRREGDVLKVLDILATQVGVSGVFSDWPATTTFYANCRNLR
jgi:glycerophosphoryl diester phosphodiesterase